MHIFELVTHTSYQINHNFDCNAKFLIYLLTCKACPNQYVGSTKYCFRYNWNSYKCDDRNYVRAEACLQECLFEHFNSEGHNGFLHDVSVTHIDKSYGKIPLNGKTTGDIPSKSWHFIFLMLKIISKLQLAVFIIYWYHGLRYYLLLL